ncbi:hypothetical protein Y1Q_0007794 [Alligator mississippiensis]|uniref:Uncharacterized protein n=1 Tax=Alligator mississippiensis TaxID=8496 RepID=A0A151N7N8_ALLMI|nr:hypothetical protein Y1Q_0007794 [Alligator mississippiensis]
MVAKTFRTITLYSSAQVLSTTNYMHQAPGSFVRGLKISRSGDTTVIPNMAYPHQEPKDCLCVSLYLLHPSRPPATNHHHIKP